jgi:hypothetical protein
MRHEGTNADTQVKTIGSSGQISFGKQHAGRTVTVEEVEDGVWLVRTARVIPDNELWLHQPAAKQILDQAIEWAEKNPASASDLSKLERRLEKRPKRRR